VSGLAVPLPVLPPTPAPYTNSLITLFGFGLAIVGVIAFVAVVLGFARLLRRGGPSWGLLWLTLGVLVGGLLLAYVTQTSGQRAADAAADTYRPLRETAMTETIGELERAYGVSFEEYPSIPLAVEDGFFAESLTFPDGHTEQCFVVPLASGYEVRCGGNTPDSGTPLAPVS
jgi:hypothetical protein